MMTTILITLIVAGWIAVSANRRSESFEAIAVPIADQPTSYATRTAVHGGNAYSSRRLPNR